MVPIQPRVMSSSSALNYATHLFSGCVGRVGVCARSAVIVYPACTRIVPVNTSTNALTGMWSSSDSNVFDVNGSLFPGPGRVYCSWPSE